MWSNLGHKKTVESFMSNNAVELKSEDFLAALNRNLDLHFFLSDRTQAKQKFSQLKNGEKLPIMKLGFSDQSELECSLVLDHSEYVGKVNFGAFRKHLAMMMHGIKTRLESDAELNVMRDASGQVLFNIPGIVRDEKSTNVLVCGLAQTTASEANINLMFLNPDAYDQALKDSAADQDS